MTELSVFIDRKVLMQGDGWSLESFMLHPTVRLKWSQAIRKLKLQERPLFDMIWDGKRTRAKRNLEVFGNVTNTHCEISKTPFRCNPTTEIQNEMLERVNKERNEMYNAMIINEYLNGHQSIGPHSDNPRALGKHGVDTISFGATRICRIRKKVIPGDGVFPNPGEIVLDVPCVNGSVLSMMGTFQQLYTHEIVVDPYTVTARRSVTFRWVKETDTENGNQQEQKQEETEENVEKEEEPQTKVNVDDINNTTTTQFANMNITPNKDVRE